MHSTLITLIFLSLAYFASLLMANDQIYKRNSWSADKLFRLSVDQFFRWSVVQLFGCSAVQLFRWSVDLLICSSGDQLSPLISILFLVSVTLATEYPAPPATCIVLLAWCCNMRAWSWGSLFFEVADYGYARKNKTALSKPVRTERRGGRCPQCTWNICW